MASFRVSAASALALANVSIAATSHCLIAVLFIVCSLLSLVPRRAIRYDTCRPRACLGQRYYDRTVATSRGTGGTSAMSVKQVRVVDSHTAGEPTRVVIEGGPDLGGDSI